MPQIVFYGVGAVMIGLLQAHRRFAAPMFAPILNNLVVIGTFLAYAAVRGNPAAGRGGDHGPREDHPRRRDDAGRHRDDGRAVALAPIDRLPPPPPTGVATRGCPAARPSRGVGRALRRRQPARLRGRDHPEQPFRRRAADLHDCVHRVPAPPRDLRRLDLHRVAARHERTVGHRQPGGRPHVPLPWPPRHRRRDDPRGVRTLRPRGADRSAPVRARSRLSKRTPSPSPRLCRASRRASCSSRRSSSSRGPSTRCRTPGRPPS